MEIFAVFDRVEAQGRAVALKPGGGVEKNGLGATSTNEDHQWAGGTPKNLPPRPGASEYEEFRRNLDAERTRDKSNDLPSQKTKLPGRTLRTALKGDPKYRRSWTELFCPCGETGELAQLLGGPHERAQ
jgi:hypothetical protein